MNINPEIVSTVTSAVSTPGATSIIPAATTATNPVIETLTAAAKGLSPTAKIAIGAGVGGVAIVGGVLVYRSWRKNHPKDTTSESAPKQKPLDDAAEIDSDETETDVEVEVIEDGEKLTALHEMAVELTVKLYKKGFTGKDLLMEMVATTIEHVSDGQVGYKFIKDSVEAGINAATKSDDKDNEKK